MKSSEAMILAVMNDDQSFIHIFLHSSNNLNCGERYEIYVLSYIHLYHGFDIRSIYCYLIYWTPLKTVAVLYADVFLCGRDTRTLNANDHFSIITWVIFTDSNVISFHMFYHFFLKNPDKSRKS